ncbi:1835_t:CDS:2 [Paraglomus occultum]|uniref:1835_t:CDS:1 n=1 Tax=Paraglomus occultum TaxID=144539 RepID=A0A9N8ZTY4_9GLOM|nr:1835_t:CDS:2 [Paraglomus occultum]
MNVLIKDGVAKITDFGLSNDLKKVVLTSKGAGNAAYIDPLRLIDPSYIRGKESDIFSVGVILWEISSGEIPYAGYDDTYVAIERFHGRRHPIFPGTPEDG